MKTLVLSKALVLVVAAVSFMGIAVAEAQEGGGQVPGLEYPDIDIGDGYPGGGSTCMECQLRQGLPDQDGNPTFFYRCYKPQGRGYSGKTDCQPASNGCSGQRCEVILT